MNINPVTKHRGGDQAVDRACGACRQLAEELREQPVLGRRQRHTRRQQRPPVQAAERRDHADHRDPLAPRPTEDRGRRVGERRVRVLQRRERDDPHDGHGRDDVDERRDRRAQVGRPRDRPLGVLHLLGRHGRRLEPDERPQREPDRHRDALEQRERVTSEPSRRLQERREVIGLEVEQADDADQRERDELEDRRHELDPAALTDAQDVDEREQPDRADGEERHGEGLSANPGQTIVVKPTNATAMAALPTHAAIQ